MKLSRVRQIGAILTLLGALSFALVVKYGSEKFAGSSGLEVRNLYFLVFLSVSMLSCGVSQLSTGLSVIELEVKFAQQSTLKKCLISFVAMLVSGVIFAIVGQLLH